MKTLNPSATWILICSIIVVSSATKHHSSHHNATSHHGDSPSLKTHHNTIVPHGIQIPEQVLSTQDVACVSADSNIFEIMYKAQETCKGNDLKCTFYHLVNEDYNKIGTTDVNKQLFDDLLMKFDNWLLTAEKIDKNDKGDENIEEEESAATDGLNNNAHLKANVNEKESPHTKHGKHIKKDHKINDTDNSKVHTHHVKKPHDSHHNKNSSVHGDESINENYIVKDAEYNKEHKYFEVFLPKDKESGKPKTIYVEIDKDKNEFVLLDEDVDKELQNDKPIKIELDELSEIADTAFKNIVKSSNHTEHNDNDLTDDEMAMMNDISNYSAVHDDEANSDVDEEESPQNNLNPTILIPDHTTVNATENGRRNLVDPNHQAPFNVELQLENPTNDHLELLESIDSENETPHDDLESSNNNNNDDLDLDDIEFSYHDTEHENVINTDDSIIELVENHDIGNHFLPLDKPGLQTAKPFQINISPSTLDPAPRISDYTGSQLDPIQPVSPHGISPVPNIPLSTFTTVPILGKDLARVLETDSHLQDSFPAYATLDTSSNSDFEHPTISSYTSAGDSTTTPNIYHDISRTFPRPPVSENSPLNVGFSSRPSYSRVEELRLPNSAYSPQDYIPRLPNRSTEFPGSVESTDGTILIEDQSVYLIDDQETSLSPESFYLHEGTVVVPKHSSSPSQLPNTFNRIAATSNFRENPLPVAPCNFKNVLPPPGPIQPIPQPSSCLPSKNNLGYIKQLPFDTSSCELSPILDKQPTIIPYSPYRNNPYPTFPYNVNPYLKPPYLGPQLPVTPSQPVPNSSPLSLDQTCSYTNGDYPQETRPISFSPYTPISPLNPLLQRPNFYPNTLSPYLWNSIPYHTLPSPYTIIPDQDIRNYPPTVINNLSPEDLIENKVFRPSPSRPVPVTYLEQPCSSNNMIEMSPSRYIPQSPVHTPPVQMESNPSFNLERDLQFLSLKYDIPLTNMLKNLGTYSNDKTSQTPLSNPCSKEWNGYVQTNNGVAYEETRTGDEELLSESDLSTKIPLDTSLIGRHLNIKSPSMMLESHDAQINTVSSQTKVPITPNTSFKSQGTILDSSLFSPHLSIVSPTNSFLSKENEIVQSESDASLMPLDSSVIGPHLGVGSPPVIIDLNKSQIKTFSAQPKVSLTQVESAFKNQPSISSFDSSLLNTHKSQISEVKPILSSEIQSINEMLPDSEFTEFTHLDSSQLDFVNELEYSKNVQYKKPAGTLSPAIKLHEPGKYLFSNVVGSEGDSSDLIPLDSSLIGPHLNTGSSQITMNAAKYNPVPIKSQNTFLTDIKDEELESIILPPSLLPSLLNTHAKANLNLNTHTQDTKLNGLTDISIKDYKIVEPIPNFSPIGSQVSYLSSKDSGTAQHKIMSPEMSDLDYVTHLDSSLTGPNLHDIMKTSGKTTLLDSPVSSIQGTSSGLDSASKFESSIATPGIHKPLSVSDSKNRLDSSLIGQSLHHGMEHVVDGQTRLDSSLIGPSLSRIALSGDKVKMINEKLQPKPIDSSLIGLSLNSESGIGESKLSRFHNTEFSSVSNPEEFETSDFVTSHPEDESSSMYTCNQEELQPKFTYPMSVYKSQPSLSKTQLSKLLSSDHMNLRPSSSSNVCNSCFQTLPSKTPLSLEDQLLVSEFEPIREQEFSPIGSADYGHPCSESNYILTPKSLAESVSYARGFPHTPIALSPPFIQMNPQMYHGHVLVQPLNFRNILQPLSGLRPVYAAPFNANAISPLTFNAESLVYPGLFTPEVNAPLLPMELASLANIVPFNKYISSLPKSPSVIPSTELSVCNSGHNPIMHDDIMSLLDRETYQLLKDMSVLPVSQSSSTSSVPGFEQDTPPLRPTPPPLPPLQPLPLQPPPPLPPLRPLPSPPPPPPPLQPLPLQPPPPLRPLPLPPPPTLRPPPSLLPPPPPPPPLRPPPPPPPSSLLLLDTIPVFNADYTNTSPFLPDPTTNPMTPSPIYNPPQKIPYMAQIPNMPSNLQPYPKEPLGPQYSEIFGPPPEIISLPTECPETCLESEFHEIPQFIDSITDPIFSNEFLQRPLPKPSLEPLKILPSSSQNTKPQVPNPPPVFFTPIPSVYPTPLSNSFKSPMSPFYSLSSNAKPTSVPATGLPSNVPYLSRPFIPPTLPTYSYPTSPAVPDFTSPLMPTKATPSDYPYPPKPVQYRPIQSSVPYKPFATNSSPYSPVPPKPFLVETNPCSSKLMSEYSPEYGQPVSLPIYGSAPKLSTSAYSSPLTLPSNSPLLSSPTDLLSPYSSYIPTNTRPSNLSPAYLNPVSPVASCLPLKRPSSPNLNLQLTIPELQLLKLMNTLPNANAGFQFPKAYQKLNPNRIPLHSYSQIKEDIPCVEALKSNLQPTPLAEEIPCFYDPEETVCTYSNDRDEKCYEQAYFKRPLESLSCTLAPEEIDEEEPEENFFEQEDLLPCTPEICLGIPELQSEPYQRPDLTPYTPQYDEPLRPYPAEQQSLPPLYLIDPIQQNTFDNLPLVSPYKPLKGPPAILDKPLKQYSEAQFLPPPPLIETIQETFENLPLAPSFKHLKFPPAILPSIFYTPLLKPLAPSIPAPYLPSSVPLLPNPCTDISLSPCNIIPINKKPLLSSPYFSPPSQGIPSLPIDPKRFRNVISPQVPSDFFQVSSGSYSMAVPSPISNPVPQPPTVPYIPNNYISIPQKYSELQPKTSPSQGFLRPLQTPLYSQYVTPLEVPITVPSLKKTKPEISPKYIPSILPTEYLPLNEIPAQYQPYLQPPTALTHLPQSVFKSPPVATPYTVLPSLNNIAQPGKNLNTPQWLSSTPQYSLPPSAPKIPLPNVPYSEPTPYITKKPMTNHILPASIFFIPDRDQTQTNKFTPSCNIPRFTLPSLALTELPTTVLGVTSSRPLEKTVPAQAILNPRPQSSVPSLPYLTQPLQPPDSYPVQPHPNVPYTTQPSSPMTPQYVTPSPAISYTSTPLQKLPYQLKQEPIVPQFSLPYTPVHGPSIHSSSSARNPFINQDFKPVRKPSLYSVTNDCISPLNSIILSNILQPLDICPKYPNSYSSPITSPVPLPSPSLIPLAETFPQKSCQLQPQINSVPPLLPSTNFFQESPLLKPLLSTSQNYAPLFPIPRSAFKPVTPEKYSSFSLPDSLVPVVPDNLALINPSPQYNLLKPLLNKYQSPIPTLTPSYSNYNILETSPRLSTKANIAEPIEVSSISAPESSPLSPEYLEAKPIEETVPNEIMPNIMDRFSPSPISYSQLKPYLPTLKPRYSSKLPFHTSVLLQNRLSSSTQYPTEIVPLLTTPALSFADDLELIEKTNQIPIQSEPLISSYSPTVIAPFFRIPSYSSLVNTDYPSPQLASSIPPTPRPQSPVYITPQEYEELTQGLPVSYTSSSPPVLTSTITGSQVTRPLFDRMTWLQSPFPVFPKSLPFEKPIEVTPETESLPILLNKYNRPFNKISPLEVYNYLHESEFSTSEVPLQLDLANQITPANPSFKLKPYTEYAEETNSNIYDTDSTRSNKNPPDISEAKPFTKSLPEFKGTIFPYNKKIVPRPQRLSKLDHFYENNHIGASPEVYTVPTNKPVSSKPDLTSPSTTANPDISRHSTDIPTNRFEPFYNPDTATLRPNEYYPEILDPFSEIPAIPVNRNYRESCLESNPQYKYAPSTMDVPEIPPHLYPCNNIKDIKYSGYKTYQLPSAFKSVQMARNVGNPPQIYPSIMTQSSAAAVPPSNMHQSPGLPFSGNPTEFLECQTPHQQIPILRTIPRLTKSDLNTLPESSEFFEPQILKYQSPILRTVPVQANSDPNSLQEDSKFHEVQMPQYQSPTLRTIPPYSTKADLQLLQESPEFLEPQIPNYQSPMQRTTLVQTKLNLNPILESPKFLEHEIPYYQSSIQTAIPLQTKSDLNPFQEDSKFYDLPIPKYQAPILSTTPYQTKSDLNTFQESPEFLIPQSPQFQTPIQSTTPLQTKSNPNPSQEDPKLNEENNIEIPISTDNINEDNELKTSLINYINRKESLRDNKNEEITVPLGNIAIIKKDPSNENIIETNNPSIGLKVWKSNLKIAQAELKLKFKNLSVNNFMPIVNNLNKYDIEEIRKVVKDYIDKKYGNHIEVKEPYIVDNKYTIIEDFDHNASENKFNLLWPTNYV